MNQELYKLANNIRTTDETAAMEPLDSFTRKKYEHSVLSAIRKERRNAKNAQKAVAAACLLLAAGMAFFHEDVHAGITKISYSISTALGLQKDLAPYKEVVNTSVSDKGYIVTLQEAVAASEKLIVSYTIEREDGQPFTNPNDQILYTQLYINGSPVNDGSARSEDFLGNEQKILAGDIIFHVGEIDLTRENNYRIEFTDTDSSNGADDIDGQWNFEFKADGSSLISDTRHLALGNSFTLPNGSKLILDEFTDNDLEQQILFHVEGDIGRCDFGLTTIDDKGRRCEFYLSQHDDDRGIMVNDEFIDNGRISLDAKSVRASVSCAELPETDGEFNYTQLGETVTWDFSKLKN